MNLAQIRSAIPEIFHSQSKKPQTDGAKNRTFRSSLRAAKIGDRYRSYRQENTLANFRPHRSYYVDAAYCYRRSSVVCLSVGRSVTIVSPAKTTEGIEMPFGLQTRVGPRNDVLDGVQIPVRRGNFEGGEGAAHCKIYGLSAVSCAKSAERIQMSFGMLSEWCGPREACVRRWCTLVPPGVYHRTVHARLRCGLFVKLLRPLVDSRTAQKHVRLSCVLVHGQVTIIFVVSVGLSVCLSVCLFVCLFVQSFSQPALIRFRSNLDICYMSGSSCVP